MPSRPDQPALAMASFNTNVDYNESRGAEINGVGWVFTGIATVTVGLKFYARMDKTQRLGWDDFFIFLSWVSCLNGPAREDKSCG